MQLGHQLMQFHHIPESHLFLLNHTHKHTGIGFNTVILSSFVVVQQHFVKHRSLAAGLSAAGISVGSLTSGPIIGFFIRSYGWRGTLLLMAGLALNCVIFSLFYKFVLFYAGVCVSLRSC